MHIGGRAYTLHNIDKKEKLKSQIRAWHEIASPGGINFVPGTNLYLNSVWKAWILHCKE